MRRFDVSPVRRRLYSFVTFVAVVAALACRREERPSGQAPTRAPDPAAFEWAGCAVVRTGPRCEMGADRTLTVWIPGEIGGLKFSTDRGDVQPATKKPVQDGWRLTFEIPPGARSLSAGKTWSLALGEATVHREIDDLLAAGKKGNHQQSAARLKDIIATGSPETRGPAHAAYARLQLPLGNLEEAEPAFKTAMDLARAEGRVSDEIKDGAALIWALVTLRQRFGDARAVLSRLRAVDPQFPEARVRVAYNDGLLAAQTGDLRTALSKYRASENLAERLGRFDQADHSSVEVAGILTTVGRADEAVLILDQLEAKKPASTTPPDPCARATRVVNRSWAMMQAARDPRKPDERVTAVLAEARKATDQCPDPQRRLVAAINSAVYALQTGDRVGAEQLVSALRSHPPSTDAITASWRADVFGHAALLNGNAADALANFDEEIAIARAAGLSEETFRGQVGAGRALLAAKRTAAAIARLKVAQGLLERALEGIPLAEGRGEFLSGHSEAVRYLVDALETSGAVREAMRVARLARSVELALASRLDRLSRLPESERRTWDAALERYARERRALEKDVEEDWKLPRSALERARRDREARAAQARDILDQAYGLLVAHGPDRRRVIREPAAGDVELTLFPAGSRWIAFAASGRRVKSQRFSADALGSNEAAASVLESFSAELGAARRVRIFAYGAADSIDWHAVPWRGRPLIASMEVEYGLDVGSAPVTKSPREMKALIVANPTGDLGAATVEADVVARALAKWQVTRLDGAAATRDAMLSALPRATLFHYAGHAEGTGASGASSALVLAHRARADLGDLLAVPRVPEVVVLSACEAAATGATKGSAQGAMMGLAQAFIASGATGVVAPTRPVGDVAARDFIDELYTAYAGGEAGSLAAAFRRAVNKNIRDRDSQSFRLVVQ